MMWGFFCYVSLHTERDIRALSDILNFLSNFLILGQRRLKSTKTLNYYNMEVPITHKTFMLESIIMEANFRIGICWQIEFFSLFCPLSSKQGLERPIWFCNSEDTSL